MAIFSRFVVASSLLTSIALAAPMNKFDVVWEVVTETAWTTLDITTTVYMDEPTAAHAATPTSAAPVITTSTTSATVAASSAPAVVVPPSSAAPVPAASTSSTAEGGEFYTSAPVVPTLAPEVATSAASSAASEPSTSPALNTPVAKAATGGPCEGSGSGCSGDVTHWDGGLGACGSTVNTESDMAIALPVGLMGSQSNGNPYCGRSVTLKNPNSGTTVQAIVMDKCMGCQGQSIDCTNKLFAAITDGKGDGRMGGIEWYFN